MAEQTLLNVDNLKLHFKTMRGVVQAVDGVNLLVDHNQAIVKT